MSLTLPLPCRCMHSQASAMVVCLLLSISGVLPFPSVFQHPPGIRLLPPLMTRSTFPLFGEHMGDCVEFSPNIWVDSTHVIRVTYGRVRIAVPQYGVYAYFSNVYIPCFKHCQHEKVTQAQQASFCARPAQQALGVPSSFHGRCVC